MRFSKNTLHLYLTALLTSSFFLLTSLPAPGGEGYTNHAGYPVPGLPVALDSRTVTLSNATETLILPLSIFPEAERRRIAADYVAADPDASPTALLVPEPVRQAIAAGEKAIRRSRLRAEKGLCTREESDAFCAQTAAALSSWLDAQLEAGAILPSEREALPW